MWIAPFKFRFSNCCAYKIFVQSLYLSLNRIVSLVLGVFQNEFFGKGSVSAAIVYI